MASRNINSKPNIPTSHSPRITKANFEDAIPFLKLEAKCFEMLFSEISLYYWRPVIDYCFAFKALYKKKIIGGAIAMPTRDGQLYVSSLFVDPKFRRSGLGTRLLNRVLALRSTNGHILDVKKDKPYLVAFYARRGFKRRTIMRNYYSDGSDRIIMVRRKK